MADSIKVSELKKLWEAEAEGKILKWNQIRPEWPDAEIKLHNAGGFRARLTTSRKSWWERWTGWKAATRLARTIQNLS